MPSPTRPFTLSDAEQVAAPPPVYPPQELPLPAQQNSDGVAHSPSIKWPEAGGSDDLVKPYKSLR